LNNSPLCFTSLSRQRYGVFLSANAKSESSRPAIALAPNHRLCNFRAEPGSMSRWATTVWSTLNHGVPHARWAQPRSPEAVEFGLLPQLQRQPASPPLTRALRPQVTQVHADGIDVVRRHRAGREQCHLGPRAVHLHVDGLASGLALTGVDLAEAEHLALRHAPIGKTPILDKVPVLVRLAVLHTSGAAQEHAPPPYEPRPTSTRIQVVTTSVSPIPSVTDQAPASADRSESQETSAGLSKTG
jgi:hypothetical protein